MTQAYDELDILSKSYPALQDGESRVHNIKRRVFLIKQRLGYNDAVASTPVYVEPQRREPDQISSELQALKAKLRPR